MVGRGNQRERAVASALRELGYLVSSRRHEAGAGDLLALPVWRHVHCLPLLVEVKGTTDLPWRSNWGPDDRAQMIEAGVRYRLEPMLAWWPPGLRGGPVWLPISDWPA